MNLVRYILFLGVLFFASTSVKAKSKDSIVFYKKQLQVKTISNEKKIRAYYNLYSYLEASSPKVAQKYLLMGYQLALKTHSNFGRGWYLKVHSYNALTSGKLDKGICFSQLASRFFKLANDTVNYSDANYQSAYGFLMKGNLSKSKYILLKTIEILPKNRFYAQQGKIYSLLAYTENDKNLVRSLEYLLKSRNATLLAKNDKGLYSVYTDLSMFYFNIEAYLKALYNSKRALYWVKHNKPINTFDYTTVTSNIAAIYFAKNNYKNAYYYAYLSYNSAIKIKSDDFIVKALIIKAQALYELNKMDEFAEQIKQLNQYKLTNNQQFSVCLLRIKEALYYNRIESVLNLKLLADSLLLNQSSLTLKQQELYFNLLCQFFKKTANKQAYLTAFKQYHDIKISSLTKQSDNRLFQLQFKSLQKQKVYSQKAYHQQLVTNRSLKKSIHQERLLFIISFIFISFLFLLVTWSIYLYRKRNKQLREFNGILEELVLEKEVLLREIHHRVKNNFQIINSLLSIQSRQKNGSIKSFLTQFSSRIHSMAFVHEKLYGNKVVGQLNVVTFLRELLEHSCATFPDQTLKIDLVVDGKAIYLPIEQLMPIGLIVNELTVNSLKYAFPMQENGMIAIAIDQNDQQVLLSFQDNGIGKIDPTMKNTGLIVVDAFVMKLRGTVIVNHEKGLHYQFVFPKKVAQK